ncbi:DUF3631 domain-containing protein [Mycolicibacterium lacusdiani]|uniref:DUF3631 domain-containing protein n=1 Tax=Mycolicibacterium lacusdiani TaxID=2895283 RepID=UPI001F26E407|nr:DUF3631 domain-containing protein [Mycolicibacterium lacusdiani]
MTDVAGGGGELFGAVEKFADQYLAFPTDHHLTVVCLWAAHTWALSAFYVTPRLILDSPEPGSGKTRVLEVLGLLCRDAKLTVSTTTAALYRRIAAADDAPPTVLQDEADAVFGRVSTPQAEELRALYNAGYKRGATVDRCQGDARSMKVVEFPVFAPVALAGLAGKMPATITSRGITLHMRRRAPGERVAEFRERDAGLKAVLLREGLQHWAEANLQALTDARPDMPKGVRDRPAEVWEALLSIADVVGGDWPRRAREACRYFVLESNADDRLSFGVRLLSDVREAFGSRDRMFSANIVSTLLFDPESEWRDLWGVPLNQSRLAKELKRYGVESQEVRIGADHRKGYLVSGQTGLAQAWARYLPAGGKRDVRDTGDIAGQSVADVSRIQRERDKRDTSATTESGPEQQRRLDVADVADVAPANGISRRDTPLHRLPRRQCGCGRPGPIHADTGLCTWCELKASKRQEAAS